MICNKCNHKLPDDSEYCQYCGNKVKKVKAVPSKMTLEEYSVGDKISEYGPSALLEMQARKTVEIMKSNKESQPDNEDDIDFGLVPEKPIFTLAMLLVDGEKEYLDQLYSDKGEKIKYTRRGSMSVDGINGMIDIYDTFLSSGQLYKTIYINMYGERKSTKAPNGFILKNLEKHKCIASKKVKPVKTKYCSRCGSVVDSKTKKCTGCNKQYFRGFRFTRFSVIVIALGLVIVTLSALCVVQHVNMQKLIKENQSNVRRLENKIFYLEKKDISNQSYVDYLENEVDALHEKNSENHDKLRFFSMSSVIIGNDGTNTYHKWECEYLDMSDGFWIFNIDAAIDQGYTACSYCN